LAGAILGVLVVIIFTEPLLRHSITKDVGLGVIALAPAIIIIYLILFGLIGGILGVIIYNLIKTYKQRRVSGVK